jgi:F0F1-type ATP synthase delta subunit
MKNKIIEKIIDALLDQRNTLNYELANLNHNEVSFNDRKNTIEQALGQIDMQISNNLMNCTVSNSELN